MREVPWNLKFRPKKFSEVIGQTHIVQFFKIVLKHYYEKQAGLPVGVLFGGHSGVGKTTLARIIAASLNCSSRQGVEPCGVCSSCKHIIEGEGNIFEIDASFFGSVGNMRDLRTRLSSYSFNSYEIVIVDEAHLLSREAASIFLKLLEEPPENVFFVLITTELHKILDTVRSRLLEFRFRIIRSDLIYKYLREILKEEKVECSDELIQKLYQLAQGNLRDVIVSLEQLSILGDGIITEEGVSMVCGDIHIYENVLKALLSANYAQAVDLYEKVALVQPDFKLFIDGFLSYLGGVFKEAIKSGDNIAVIYSLFFRRIYKFLSLPLGLGQFASVNLLFSDLIEVVKKTKGITTFTPQSDDVISNKVVFELLANKK